MSLGNDNAPDPPPVMNAVPLTLHAILRGIEWLKQLCLPNLISRKMLAFFLKGDEEV